MKKILAFTLALALAAPLGAIELSLEENRAERGNIGYIDMPKLFKQFPETLKAKENFEEIVRQTEDQLNLRKAEILKLRNELSQLRMEREILVKAIPAPLKETPKAVEKPKEPAKPAEAPKPPEPVKPPAPPKPPLNDLSGLPGFGPPEGAKSEEKKPDSLVINIPGVSTAPVVVQPPEPEQPAQPAISTAPAAAPVVAAVVAAPAVSTAPAAAVGPDPALTELEAKIALRTAELAGKEAEFKRYQADQEKNLLDLESRKTEVLLGKIHRAVQEVAKREGVSVVVDKTSILYGHDAVDLTEKVLKLLRGT